MRLTGLSILFAVASLSMMTGAAAALDIALPPGARMTAETTTDAGSYRLPIAPWSEGGIPSERIEGPVSRQAWRIDGQRATTQQVMAPLRDQIIAAGYSLALDCAAQLCGGFDFRFNTEVLQGPDMYVDLTDYRFLSARAPEGGAISLLVSNSSAATFLQIIKVGTEIAPLDIDPAPSTVATEGSASLPDRLETQGHAVLRDLQFPSGVSDLGSGPIASLDALADYLQSRPDARIMFVGHTDATGSLDANVALSRRRAQAAVTYLRNSHDISASRISAEGVGFLSPVSSNLTEEGRLLNRRIEAVLISTE
jgi:OOP family OmpA-OmpF porin